MWVLATKDLKNNLHHRHKEEVEGCEVQLRALRDGETGSFVWNLGRCVQVRTCLYLENADYWVKCTIQMEAMDVSFQLSNGGKKKQNANIHTNVWSNEEIQARVIVCDAWERYNNCQA